MVFATQSLIKLCEIADYRPKKKSSKRKKGELLFFIDKKGDDNNEKLKTRTIISIILY